MTDTKTILLVEDDEFKAKDIQKLVLSVCPDVKLTSVADVASAISEIQTTEFCLIILDIALPSRRLRRGAGSTSSLLSGGLEIIYRLEARDRSDPVLIVTQYPDVEVEGEFVSVKSLGGSPEKYFNANIIGCVRFDRKQRSAWTAAVIAAMERVL